MVVIFKFYSQTCLSEFALNPNCLTFYTLKKMRAVRRDILKMFTVFFSHVGDKQAVAGKYLPPIFEMLSAYKDEPEALREPDMLLLFAKVIQEFGQLISQFIPNILDLTFTSTLGMISSNFQSYPDHRFNFFVFLKNVIENCFQQLLSIPKEQLTTVIDCVIWSIKHELGNFYEVGLESLLALINVAPAHPESELQPRAGQQLLQELLHADILRRLLRADRQAARERLRAADADPPDHDPSPRPRTLLSPQLTVQLNDGEPNNKNFVLLAIYSKMVEGFPNLSKEDHQKNLQCLFTSYADEEKFKSDLRDYLAVLDLFTNTELARTN